MTGRITRWVPDLGMGELVGEDGARRLFLHADVSASTWPPSAQDALALRWVPSVGAAVEFTPGPAAGCLGPRARSVRRRLIRH